MTENLETLLAQAHSRAETPRQAQLVNALSWALDRPLDLYGDGRGILPPAEFGGLHAQTLMSMLIVEVAIYRARERAVLA